MDTGRGVLAALGGHTHDAYVRANVPGISRRPSHGFARSREKHAHTSLDIVTRRLPLFFIVEERAHQLQQNQ
jgi:hypothetical protein